MEKKKIKIGYEIPTGQEVNIPLAHTVITGLTAESGKTTALMGLAKRSGFKVLIIKTKIGEKAISEGSLIPPFYKENFDWEYASELLEASRKEKLKFERSWIIRYSKGANSLLEFKKNIDTALEGKLRELDKSVLMSLQAYLEKILPELQYAPLSKTLDLREGINIMDLERFKEETQSIIIKSVLEEILNKEKNTLVVLPECWRYLPERLSTPVKRPAEAFIRQGATNQNFLILDSQDVTGISKTILKQVSVWIMGYQREINEVKRVLDQLNISNKLKPKPEDIATLKLGQFYVATSEFVKKVYAQPVWLEDSVAKKVSMGKIDVSELEQPTHIAPFQVVSKEKEVLTKTNKELEYLPKKINELREDFILNRNDFFNKFQQMNETIAKIFEEIYKIKNENKCIDENEIVMRVLQKLPSPSITSQSLDKDLIIKEIMLRIPKSTGSVVYEVAPLEKIKKDFLSEAKEHILKEVNKLDDEQKKMLKFIESQGKGCSQTMLIDKCLFLSATSGGTRNKVSTKTTEMGTLLVIKKDAHAICYPNVKDFIKSYLGIHEATEQEIEQVYNHILMEMLK